MKRYYHTLKYLRREQILYRLKYRLQRWAKPNTNVTGNITSYPLGTFQELLTYQNALKCPFHAAQLKKGLFEFINIQEQTSFPPKWDFQSKYKLWRYQLHYFDWIWALEYQDAKSCVTDWIEQYTYTSTRDGWEAYPTSLRLINWGIYFLVHQVERLEQDSSFQSKLLTLFQIQSNWLENRLEFHLLANHLLENAACLALMGCLSKGNDAERWRRKGFQLLQQEIKEQILPDGGHYERSPMYHLRMLHILKYVLLADQIDTHEELTQSLALMEEAFQYMCHPDGDIALFNDSDFDVYPLPPNSKDKRSENTTNGAWKLDKTGYYGYESTEGDYLIVDAGELGPSYNPGHAHADIFSYELSYGKERLIVDSGNFDYEPGPMRAYCRSTKAHNTVEIDDTDQCHLWGTFRIAERATPRHIQFQSLDHGFKLDACQDGYRRLKANATHRRTIQFDASTGLIVLDLINAQYSVKAISRIHFHPDCNITQQSENSLKISRANVSCIIQWASDCQATLTDSYYCPRFNVSIENKCLELEKFGATIKINYTIGPKLKQ